MAQQYQQPQLKVKYHTSFNGGKNSAFGVRQVKDNESPDTVNTDFKGQSGIGNRAGYTQVGAVADSRTAVYGMNEYHTSALSQMVKFASNASNVALYYSTGGAWTAAAGNTLTDGLNVDTVQAVISSTAVPTPAAPLTTDGVLFTFNGTDAMQKFDGTTVSAHTGGTKGLYGAYFNERLWCVDELYFDTLNASSQTFDTAANSALSFTTNGTVSTPLALTFKPGSGAIITGLKKFKTSLYVFLSDAIYKIDTSSTANQYTISLVTNSVGCVSHRSIAQVGEDLYFAANDGIYSLGEVALYTSVRTVNKSARIQGLFDNLSGTNKAKLVGKYFNFKYYLFYSLYGSSNDSVAVYDIRYQGWLDWRVIAGQDATLYTNSAKTQGLFFGEPTTGKVHQINSGTTDDGTVISSYFYTKSFDEGTPDVIKLYFDTTYVFSSLNGSVTVSVIFDDSIVASTTAITQINPQGGFGFEKFGRNAFGKESNTVTVTNVQNVPLRQTAKGQKFAIQYLISSTGSWTLNTIVERFNVIPMKFPSANKIS